MHKLTIDDDGTPVAISGHSSFHDAHRALLRYAIGADYYLHTVDDTAARTRYRLLRLADPDHPRPGRAPRITGTATIEHLPDTGPPVPSAQLAAPEAHRWIAEHAGTWRHGSATDADDLSHPGQAALEAVRHSAISGEPTDNPAAIAAAVGRLQPADTSDQQTAALIWYHTLLCWGANAP
jgi:hypothetical protein